MDSALARTRLLAAEAPLTALRRLLSLRLLALLWLLPPLLPLAQRPALHFYREWLAGILVLAACALWLPLRGRAITLPRSAVFLLALAVYLLLQIPLVRVPYHEPAIGYALYLGWAALAVTTAAGVREVFGVDAVMRTICWAALASAVLAALIGAMQAFGVPAWLDLVVLQDKDSRVNGNLQHAGYFADQMLLGVVAAAYLYANRWLRTSSLLGALAVIPLGLALCGSRLTVLVLLLLPLSALMLWLREREPGTRRLLAASAIAPLAFIAWEWALRAVPWIASHWERMSTLTRLPHDASGMGLRWMLWEKALVIFADAPVLGAGVDAFPWHYFRSLQVQPPLAYTIHSHNLFTEALACYGLIGTGLLTVMLLAFAWQYRARLLALTWWPVSAMLGVLLLRALLDLNLWFAHLLALFAVLLGVADSKGITLRARHAVIALVAAIVSGTLMLAITIRDYRMLADIGIGRTTAHEIIAGLETARRNPFFTALVDSMRADATPVAVQGDRAQLALNSRSMNWRPTPRMVWRQTALLAVNGYPAAACRLLARAWLIHPRHEPRAHAWLERNAQIPALALLLSQLDALKGGADADTVCKE